MNVEIRTISTQRKRWGTRALATSLAWLSTSVIMTLDLARHSGVTLSRDMAGWLVRLLVSVAAACVVWLLLRKLWALPPDAGLVTQFVWLITLGLLGASAYVGLSFWLRLPEPRRMWETVGNRFVR